MENQVTSTASDSNKSFNFDPVLSLHLDGVILALEDAQAKGLQGIVAKLREQKRQIEDFIFGGQTHPQYPIRRLDYYEYIQSPEWKERAENFKRMAGYRCRVCNKGRYEATLTAHHRTYERLGNELPEDVTVLCDDCHELFEKHKRLNGHGGAQ